MRNLIPEKIIGNLKQGRFRDEFECFSIFVDISGFTSTTEALMKYGHEGAEVLSDILRYLFDTTVKAVYEHGGYVTKYAGDAFTALFEPGNNYTQTAVNVLNTAIITNRFFAENKIFRSKFGDFEFGVKVGMGFGHCICGIVGTDKEKSYYFSGPAVDLCAMAEHNAVKGDIWMSEGVFEYLSDIIISPEKNSIYGRNFYKVNRTHKFKPVSSQYRPGVFDIDLIYRLAGRPESEFPVGEFRDVISVFISFEGDVDLNNLMKHLYELKKTYGSSHPVIDFGDKGGNILLFFGAPVSYENNSFRALSLILKLVEYSGSIFNIRAGLAKGVVYCGFNGSELRNEFTCLGNTVNQSARFMMKAEWGQVLIDKNLASDENFTTEHLADIQYKGREGLIATYILKSKAEIKDIFFKGSFVGREKELARLSKHLEPLQRGKNCGVIYVDGEAGIGKSRLVNHLRQELTKDKKTIWFYLSCDEIIREPFNPFRYFFARYFDFGDEALEKNSEVFENIYSSIINSAVDEKLRTDLEKYKDYLAYFLNLKVKNTAILSEEPDERQNSVILSLINFFRAFSLNGGLVLEFDNAGVIDDDSVKLLQRIITSVRRSGFASIMNCRYKYNGDKYDFKLPTSKRIQLKPLNKSEFKKLTSDRLSLKRIPKDTLDILDEKSGRNPLYLEQIVKYIKENSILDTNNRVKDISGIPNGINDIIIARFDKLQTHLKEVLKTASCIGNEIHIDLISYIFRSKYPDLKKYLLDLENEDILILISELSYLFKFSVIRDALYSIQLKKTVRDVHYLIGESIECIHKNVIENYYSVLAYHFEKAENSIKAIEYHKKAGFRSKKEFQNSQALFHFNSASKLLTEKIGTDENSWLDIDPKENLSEIEEFTEINLERFHFYFSILQDIDKCEKIIGLISFLVAKTGNKKFSAQILMEQSLIDRNRGNYDLSNKHIEQAVTLFEELGMKNKISLCYLNLGTNYFTVGKMDEALKNYLTALKYTEKIEDYYKRKSLEAKIKGNIGIIYDYSGDFDKALEFYKTQLEITEELNLKTEKASALGNIGIVHHLSGNLVKAKEYYEKKLVITEELGRRLDYAELLNNLGFLYKDLGQYKKAVSFHKKSFTLSRELNDFNTMAGASINLGHVYTALKDYSKAEAGFLKGVEIAEKYSFKHLVAEGMVEIAGLYLISGNKDTASDFLEKGIKAAEESGFAEYIEKGKMLKNKIAENI
jgi:class 3 adenylate cyclase/tetratricopeptide (TPR) repeat protein